MLSSPSLRLPATPLHVHPFTTSSGKPAASRSRVLAGPCRRGNGEVLSPTPSPSSSLPFPRALWKPVPLAASVAVLLWCHPVDAGILSGFSGLESMAGPQLPEIDFIKKWNEENQKKYADLDSRFKSSPVLKGLLEKSKLNKARNQRELQDKYCIRGAEWGVGDCSTQGMTEEERVAFIAELKRRSGE